MEYIERHYRNHFRKDRWAHFRIQYKETDLWIGVDKASYRKDIEKAAQQQVQQLRGVMDEWIADHPDYARSLVPYPAPADAPRIFQEMSLAAIQTKIGPMSAVAGAVAQQVGKTLQHQFGIREIVIENGGDIYASLQNDLDIAVFAGSSPLSEKVGLHIKAVYAPLGICTSSGTVGPSLSFGKADAVLIVCQDTLLADSYATAFANQIQTAEDIQPCLSQIQAEKAILGALIIKGDKMGVCGQFDLKFFN